EASGRASVGCGVPYGPHEIRVVGRLFNPRKTQTASVVRQRQPTFLTLICLTRICSEHATKKHCNCLRWTSHRSDIDELEDLVVTSLERSQQLDATKQGVDVGVGQSIGIDAVLCVN